MVHSALIGWYRSAHTHTPARLFLEHSVKVALSSSSSSILATARQEPIGPARWSEPTTGRCSAHMAMPLVCAVQLPTTDALQPTRLHPSVHSTYCSPLSGIACTSTIVRPLGCSSGSLSSSLSFRSPPSLINKIKYYINCFFILIVI